MKKEKSTDTSERPFDLLVMCGVCDKPFEPWMDGGELEDEVCFMCDQSYQEGALFDRDNFEDS